MDLGGVRVNLIKIHCIKLPKNKKKLYFKKESAKGDYMPDWVLSQQGMVHYPIRTLDEHSGCHIYRSREGPDIAFDDSL